MLKYLKLNYNMTKEERTGKRTYNVSQVKNTPNPVNF